MRQSIRPSRFRARPSSRRMNLLSVSPYLSPKGKREGIMERDLGSGRENNALMEIITIKWNIYKYTQNQYSAQSPWWQLCHCHYWCCTVGSRRGPDQTQQQMGTEFKRWILELDLGMQRLRLKAVQRKSFLDVSHWRKLNPGDCSALYWIWHIWNGTPCQSL